MEGIAADGFISAGGLSPGSGASGGDTSMVVNGSIATFTSSSTTFQTYSKTYLDTAISAAGSVNAVKVGSQLYNPDSNKIVNLPNYLTSAVTSITAGIGLAGGAITSVGTIKAKLKNETANADTAIRNTSSTGGLYAIEVDAAGDLSVRIP